MRTVHPDYPKLVNSTKNKTPGGRLKQLVIAVLILLAIAVLVGTIAYTVNHINEVLQPSQGVGA